MSEAPSDLPAVPARDAESHKGTHGTVCVVGGCCAPGVRMIGAPALVARGTLRAGCGLARLVCPEPILDAAIGIEPGATGWGLACTPDGRVETHEGARVLDAVTRMASCIAIGPGLGDAEAGGEAAEALTLRAIQQEETSVVVDADAINALSRIASVSLDFRAAAVLTPHPGEFRRLAEALGHQNHMGLADDRAGAAEAMAQRLGCVVVLKGHRTVVSDGSRTWTNQTGHPCLATAGTGDVLTGVIAGLISQFVGPPQAFALPGGRQMPKPPGKPFDLFDAARIAVAVHGAAGEAWARAHGASAGLRASDLADLIPGVLEGMRES